MVPTISSASFLSSAPGSLRPGTNDTCVNISSSVTYSVQITALPEACQAPDQVVNARIQFVGFGQVDLTIALQCDCGCEADTVRRIT